MNRRHLAAIAMIIAVPLFAGPLVSPVPTYDAHLEVDVHGPLNFSTAEEKEARLRNETTVRYRTLSAPKQRLFERGTKQTDGEISVRLAEAPETWATLVPEQNRYSWTVVYVQKGGHYYSIRLSQFTPGPSFLAFMLRLGPLLAAIGLGTLAGYFVLTAED
jgi:hypothetical protein